MDHAIGTCDIRRDDFGVVDHDATAGGRNLDTRTYYGFRSRQTDHVLGHDFARNNMVSQDAGQLSLVFWFQQTLQSSRWKFGECFIGGCEDGEWAVAFQCVDQSGSFDSCNQRLETTCSYGGVDDIFLLCVYET